MAAVRMLVAVVVALCCILGCVAAFEEVKPNNYPNFEFYESPVQDTAEVKSQSFGGGEAAEFSETTPVVESEHDYKPNNYKDFKFTEEKGTVYESQGRGGSENGHDEFAKGHYNTFDASDRFPATENRFNNHESSSAQDEMVYDAHQRTREVAYKTGEPEYRGSDASHRYPSSYELINAREHESNVPLAGYESFGTNEVRFTNVHKVEGVNRAPVIAHTEKSPLGGSSRLYTPASDPDFAFRFAKPDSSHTFGDNEIKVDNQADENVYAQQFNFDNSDATNDPTATYGTTSPVLAADNVKNSAVTASGHGCANMYWAGQTKEWPLFFDVTTQVSQAFGPKVGDIYGTTTLLQALYDTREDGYSQLLSHGTAALMNAYAMPNYALRHDAVIDQFLGALSSRSAAGIQAQKFLNANHAYGPNECLN